MARTIRTVDDLQTYLRGVTARATHHAQDMLGLVPVLATQVLIARDPGTDLVARTYGGGMAVVVQATIGGQVYSFSFDHDARAVSLKRGNVQGPEVASFPANPAARDVQRVLRRLGRVRVVA